MANLRVSIYCPYCHRYTDLQMAPAEWNTARESGTTACAWKAGYNRIWWIGICNYCKKPVLVKNDGAIVFPRPLPSPTDKRIPEHIRKDIDEAKICFSAGAYRACAVMARRAIQSSAIDKGAGNGKLVEQINELGKQGVITKDLKEWATVVRWVGNDAAHPSKDDVLEDDAEDILKLAEQFLEVIYVTPALAQERRKKRGK